MAEPPTVPGQTGATSEPTASPLPAILSAIARIASSLASGSVCGWNRNRSTPSNFWPLTEALAVSSSMRSRLIGGWSVPGSLPTRPGHMALWSLGKANFGEVMSCPQSITEATDGHRLTQMEAAEGTAGQASSGTSNRTLPTVFAVVADHGQFFVDVGTEVAEGD